MALSSTCAFSVVGTKGRSGVRGEADIGPGGRSGVGFECKIGLVSRSGVDLVWFE